MKPIQPMTKKSFLWKILLNVKRRFIPKKWPGSIVDGHAIIEGDPSRISLAAGVVIEAGAVVSTLHGGHIILGKNTVIRRGAMLMTYGGDIHLGENCGVNPYTVLYGHGGLTIGNHVRFATHGVVIPANHSFDQKEIPIYFQPLTKKGIVIGDDVWVGAGVMILDGVRIGDGCVLGAGSVVTKDIPARSIVVGNPARTIRQR
jgi:acetyltransferase-like isoleucine patch superfamily enzyme